MAAGPNASRDAAAKRSTEARSATSLSKANDSPPSSRMAAALRNGRARLAGPRRADGASPRVSGTCAGLLLAALYVLYLIAVAIFQPHRMPPAEHVQASGRRAALAGLARDLLAPVLQIASVLGTIIAGIATPTEAAAIGAAGAMLLALLSGNLNLGTLRTALRDTTKTTAMIVFVMIGATIFSVIFRRLGGDQMVIHAFDALGTGPYVVLFAIMALVFLLGFFLDWVEIALVVVPLVAPVVASLDFGMTQNETLTWFAIALAVNMQTSFLTPPFGYALFYLRGVATGISIGTIYRGIIPFVLLQLLALLLLIIFPQISLWLIG
jgi:tripartite ATP-independent transporter DctM subunit